MLRQPIIKPGSSAQQKRKVTDESFVELVQSNLLRHNLFS
jgi:hypothetical protein